MQLLTIYFNIQSCVRTHDLMQNTNLSFGIFLYSLPEVKRYPFSKLSLIYFFLGNFWERFDSLFWFELVIFIKEKKSPKHPYSAREGTPRRHEPPLCRYEPSIFARQTMSPPHSKSLHYTVNEPPLHKIVSLKLLVFTCIMEF